MRKNTEVILKTGCPLNGMRARVKLVGSKGKNVVVSLTENRGAYSVGDEVTVPAAELERANGRGD